MGDGNGFWRGVHELGQDSEICLLEWKSTTIAWRGRFAHNNDESVTAQKAVHGVERRGETRLQRHTPFDLPSCA